MELIILVEFIIITIIFWKNRKNKYGCNINRKGIGETYLSYDKHNDFELNLYIQHLNYIIAYLDKNDMDKPSELKIMIKEIKKGMGHESKM